MGKKSKRKKSFFARITSWLLTWPKIAYIVSNVIVIIIATTSQELITKYLFSRLIILTFFTPWLLWIFLDELRKPIDWKKFMGRVFVTLVLFVGLVLNLIICTLTLIDVFSVPEFINAKVENISDPIRSYVYYVTLEDDDFSYWGFTYMIDVIKDKTYSFRLMPASRTLIAIEQFEG